jgi:hypothetical protein
MRAAMVAARLKMMRPGNANRPMTLTMTLSHFEEQTP